MARVIDCWPIVLMTCPLPAQNIYHAAISRYLGRGLSWCAGSLAKCVDGPLGLRLEAAVML
jgi:hypothetical protein